MGHQITTVAALVLLLAGKCQASVEDDVGQFTLAAQAFNVTIGIENNVIYLITRKDGDATGWKSVLHTRYPDDWDREKFMIERNCGGGGVNNVCVKSGNITHTFVEVRSNGGLDGGRILVSRNLPIAKAQFTDCFAFGDAQWFGGPQLRYQHWPIQHMYYEVEPYLPTHPTNMALSERYWLSGKGIYIYVSERDPLFLDQNNYRDKHLCLIGQNAAPYRLRENVTLNYEIGVFANPRVAHEAVVRYHFGKPKGRPNDRMIRHPVWSTWARYKANVSETVVAEFADEIDNYRFDNSQLEIDDNWETCYGSAVFDKRKFPNITRLARMLNEKGFRVTLWIHPFINEGCEPAYSFALKNSYFVKSTDGSVHMQWWQGNDAATIDFTNPKAVSWWVGRLKLLEQSGIDSFKFDAGEVSWLPQVPSLTGEVNMQPGIFTHDYVAALSRNFDDNIEVRVGWRTQELPIFVRMIDKDTRWTWNNGLPTLITTLLQMNLNGYVHVLPDMIGGNGYLNNWLNGTVYPPKELFIRWLQANVFMPSMQYSFVPWDFDDETVAISRKYTALHATMTPAIIEAMDAAIANGTPVNPPIWWVDPTNTEAHEINDEFLLGEKFLIAPVTVEGAVARDIYLPAGRWRDAITNATVLGPRWLRNYPAPLDALPYFAKI